MKTIGIISGMGELPRAIALEAKAKGYRVLAIALESLADKDLPSVADETRWINVGKLGSIIDTLKSAGVSEAVMAGKVPKALLYKSRITPDLRAVKLLFTLRDRRDDSILLAITGELAKEGIVLLRTTDFCAGLLASEGVMTGKKPSEEEWKDIAFGWDMAKEMGRLDIGQTVVVKNKAVMAVEAIEGTDEAIRRGGRYADSGAVVVKVSKPSQDFRFDVPAVGLQTLASMAEVKAGLLAVEAGATIILDKETFIREAEAKGIAVVGIGGDIDKCRKKV